MMNVLPFDWMSQNNQEASDSVIHDIPISDYANYNYEWKLQYAVKLNKMELATPCTLRQEIIDTYF